MRVIGLTGSVGMGKSTTAAMFRKRGIPVHDADAAVRRLYAGPAAASIETAFPGVTANNVVDRARLGEIVLADPAALKKLEAIVHPLVRQSEDAFLAEAKAKGNRLALVDVPLLFETGADDRVDAIVVVTAAPEIQRARVLARPGMSEARLQAILARQMPDAEKRRRAHFLVDSGHGFESAERQVGAILGALAATL
jgi:dephospho-CoA kinase